MDALKLVFERNTFYRQMYFLMLGAFALSLVVMGLLATVLMYLYKNPTHPLYFATDEVSRLIPIIPINQPNMSTQDVTKWAIAAVEAAYTYDYVNYRAQLQSSQKYFTDYGWTKYMASLRASNNLNALTVSKQVVVTKVIAPPTLITEGILGGGYAWKFKMDLLVNYSTPPYDTKSVYSNALNIEVIIQRQPILQSYKGLGVVQMVGSYATKLTPQTMSVKPA